MNTVDIAAQATAATAVIDLKYVRVEIWSDQKCVATIFNNTSHTCVGSRDDNQQNRDEAERQGYSADANSVWRSLVEHEILHSLVAEVMFDRESRVALAESGKEITPTWERYEEEAVVLSVQHLINAHIVPATLHRVFAAGVSTYKYEHPDHKSKEEWLRKLIDRWQHDIIPILSNSGVFS